MADDQRPILFYCTSWCPDCRQAQRLLDRHRIKSQVLDIDKDPEARKLVEQINHGRRSVPTIVFSDGSNLVEPSIYQLQQKLGLD
jgi:mycoredoxin